MDHNARIDQLIGAINSWFGAVPVPPWFNPEPGETVYAVLPGVELLELRHTTGPLAGGSAGLDVAAAAAMLELRPGVARSVQVAEPVAAREAGIAVITTTRLVFVGDRDRSWRYSEMVDLAHDGSVPETWLAVESRKRTSGLRYGGDVALDLRFVLALAMATARDERPMLRSWLLAQRLPVAPTWTAGADSVPTGPAGKVKKVLGLIYLGKSTTPLPLRIAQGAAAALVTLAVVGSVLPEPARQDMELSASAGATEPDIDDTPAEAVDAAAEETARAAAEASDEQAARDAAEQVAAARAAAVEAAERKAAADKAAADQAAADKAAAEAAAAEQAAAERATAEAAAQEAARAEAERQAVAAAAAQRPTGAGTGCLPDYPDFCIPAGPDLDCPDIDGGSFTVLAPDSFRLDGNDNDGIGCESN